MANYYCSQCGQRFTEDSISKDGFCQFPPNGKSNQKHELVIGDVEVKTLDTIYYDFFQKNNLIEHHKLIFSKALGRAIDVHEANKRLKVIENIAKMLLKAYGLEYYQVRWNNNGITRCDDEAIYISVIWSILGTIDYIYESMFHEIKFTVDNQESIKEKSEFIRTNLLTDYDEKMEDICDLRWAPWIGKNYQRTQLLILGESFYEENSPSEDGNEPDNPRNLIKTHAFSSKDSINSNFFYKIANTVLDNEKPTNDKFDDFWRSVAFVNFIQPCIEAKRFKGKPRQLIANFESYWLALLQVIELIHPKLIIKTGELGLERLAYLLADESHGWEYNLDEFYQKPYIIKLEKKGYKLKIVCIDHPTRSDNYDSHYWSKIIHDNSPELIQRP
jgi:hypothetical protein